jgi:hypothetical protein
VIWQGIRIIESTSAVRLATLRVRGGYLNRWLIREQRLEPCVLMIGTDTAIVHPTLMPTLRAAAGAAP